MKVIGCVGAVVFVLIGCIAFYEVGTAIMDRLGQLTVPVVMTVAFIVMGIATYISER